MGDHDKALALADSILRDVEDDPRLIHMMNASMLVKAIGDLAAALRATETDRDQLRIAIHGGCGCSAPYTDCPHDEPLLPALNAARTENARLRAVTDTAEAMARHRPSSHSWWASWPELRDAVARLRAERKDTPDGD